jgi:hypothetical protein
MTVFVGFNVQRQSEHIVLGVTLIKILEIYREMLRVKALHDMKASCMVKVFVL